jgi:hypothetical protein
MKNIDGDMAKTPVTQRVKDLDAEFEDVIKIAEEKSSVDPSDKYRIWRCNGLPVALRFHNKRS